MRLNSEDSRALGSLVKSVNDLLILSNKLLEGDFVLNVTPIALGSSATDLTTAIAGAGFTRDVVCKIVDGEGATIEGYNSTLPVTIVATTVGDGDATLEANTLTFVNGVATATITYTGTYATDDTVVFTFGSTSTIGGTSVANKTSTDTIVA